jgi:c-di-GMP-specific phosphodiesterase
VSSGTRDGIPTEPSAIAELLKSAASIARSGGDTADAMRWALDLVCDYTGWPVGHVFSIDLATGRATSTGIWKIEDSEKYGAFRRETEAADLSEAGLPGRIATAGAPVFVPDIAADLDLPRSAAALASGLGACFGFPVVTSLGVEAVMEFFAPAAMPEEEAARDLISYVGDQLGSVIDRARADEAVRASEARLREAQRIAGVGSFSWKVGEDTVTWSEQLFRIYGLERGAGPVTFADYLSKLHPDDRDRVAGAVGTVVATLTPVEHEYRIVRPDGTVRWVEARIEIAGMRGDRPERLAGYCRDVTEARGDAERLAGARRDLESQQRILALIARGEPLPATLEVICKEVEERFPGGYCSILLADRAAGVLRLGAGPSLPAEFNASIDGLAIEVGMGACGTAAATGQVEIVEDTLVDPLTHDFRDLARRHDLRSVWSHPLVEADGTIVGTFAIYRHQPHRPGETEVQAVTALGSLAALAIVRSRAEKALLVAARIDTVTGLPNRAWFLEQLADHLAVPGGTLAVMFIGLNGLRLIRDSLGHRGGDRGIAEVATRLASFGDDSFAARSVGRTVHEVESLAEKVVAAFGEPFTIDGGEFYISSAIGIAHADHGADADGLLRNADVAMSAARGQRRSGHATFDDGLLRRSAERLSLETDLRRAIERDEFVMHYQPVADLRKGTWVGVEALVRWQHPSRGTVSPYDFVPLAEETGLIVPLGLKILDLTIEQAKAWASSGRFMEVAANLSVVQLSDPNAANEVLSRLEAAGVHPASFVVEVTETAVMEHLDVAGATLERLRDAGVRIFIDDFGTGYSSIARLGELPVVGVKIDRRFTSMLSQGGSAERIVAAITDLAHALDMLVVAEGIETLEELERVRTLGCDFGQGYLLGRPAPAADLVGVLDLPPAVD